MNIVTTGTDTVSIQSQTHISSKDEHQTAIRKKVQETFSNNLPAIIGLALLTLPVFFIAWPLAIVAIIEGAENEVIAQQRFDFVSGLSKELSADKNHGKSQKDIFKAFTDNKTYKELFNSKVKPEHLIQLAIILRNEKTNIVAEKDAILCWDKLIEFQNKIKKVLEKTKELYTTNGSTTTTTTTTTTTPIEISLEAASKAYHTAVNLTTAATRTKIADDISLNYEHVMSKMQSETEVKFILNKHIELPSTAVSDAQRGSLATISWEDKTQKSIGYSANLSESEQHNTLTKNLDIIINLISEIKKDNSSLDEEALKEIVDIIIYSITQQAACSLSSTINGHVNKLNNYFPLNQSNSIRFIYNSNEKSLTILIKGRFGISTQEEINTESCSELGGAIVFDLKMKVEINELSNTIKKRKEAIRLFNHVENIKYVYLKLDRRITSLTEDKINDLISGPDTDGFTKFINLFHDFGDIDTCLECEKIESSSNSNLTTELNEIKTIFKEIESELRKLQTGTKYSEIKETIKSKITSLRAVSKKFKAKDKLLEDQISDATKTANGIQFELTNLESHLPRINMGEQRINVEDMV